MKIERVLAPNPSLYTGPGTNTWLLDSAGSVVVIDPGPVDQRHFDAIVKALGDRPVAGVLVTHTHEDHAPLANPLAAELDTTSLGFGPGPEFEPDERLADGSLFTFGDSDIRVLFTPGHSDDHLCFIVDRVMFTGDHIIGGSSVMVDDMVSYMASLERVGQASVESMYPGHGEVIDDPEGVIDWYIAHRLQREDEILATVADGADSIDAIVAVVYRDVEVGLHPLAARSVRAHVDKLLAEDRLVGEPDDLAVGS